MNKTRLEAFSDGVLAIIITIMVLEIKVPHSTDWHAIRDLLPVLLSYMLSFVFICIYWNNHHHMMHTVKQVNARIMWSNHNLLFWLSLVPFATAWLGENGTQKEPVMIYSALFFICGFSYDILRRNIIKTYKHDTAVKEALERQKGKGVLSTACYLAAIPLAYINTNISIAIIVFVAILWIIPSKEIEKSLSE
ncbi:MAG: DUF1211 domain-containing protein [Bacteroidetes bacterium]|nr:DUF1211 domain-containing protein [Bacteroidota bacterium]